MEVWVLQVIVWVTFATGSPLCFARRSPLILVVTTYFIAFRHYRSTFLFSPWPLTQKSCELSSLIRVYSPGCLCIWASQTHKYRRTHIHTCIRHYVMCVSKYIIAKEFLYDIETILKLTTFRILICLCKQCDRKWVYALEVYAYFMNYCSFLVAQMQRVTWQLNISFSVSFKCD